MDAHRRRSLRERIQEFVRQRFGKEPSPPSGDPYAYVTAPLRRGPKGRSGAAVAEIEDDSYRSFPPRQP
jgi:hypothetical protein